MSRRGSGGLVFALTFLSAGLLAGASEAAEPASPQAQSLFEEGRTLMEKGDLDRACPMLVDSQRIDPGGGTLHNVALCHEKQGKLATAWAEYNEALSVAIRDDRKDRQDFARAQIALLRPRLPELLVVLSPGEIAGLAVEVDGSPLAPAALGVPFPVDPGAHGIVARAPGRIAASLASLPASEGHTVKVYLPALSLLPSPVSSPGPVDAPPPRRSRLSTVTYVSAAVALAGYGTAAITGLLALAADSSAKDRCNAVRDYCVDPSGRDDASRARTMAWISTVALGAGVVATAVALLWPRVPARDAVRAVILPAVFAGGGGIFARTSF